MFGSGKLYPKDNAQFEAVGTVDELNSAIGYVCALCKRPRVAKELERIQRTLFSVQAHLGTEEGYEKDTRIPKITKRHVTHLERVLTMHEKELPSLRNFILPGGSKEAASLHVCRALARRAERRIVTLSRKKALNPHTQAYLNRLSDVLFAFARGANQDAGNDEVIWKP